MGQLKAFALWVIKAALALVLAVLTLGIVGWAGFAIWDSVQKAKQEPLAKPKTWPSIKVEALENTQLTLRTMWRDGRLYYQFDVRGYPKSILAAREGKTGRVLVSPSFTISFLDENRFRLFDHAISLQSMAKIVGADGQASGLNANNDTYMNPEDYRRAAFWEIGWNFPDSSDIPSAKPDAAVPRPSKARWRDISKWRTLKRGMSKDDVRRTLGEPTRVSEMSLLTFWYYGYPSGGKIQFSKSGTLESWSEP